MDCLAFFIFYTSSFFSMCGSCILAIVFMSQKTTCCCGFLPPTMWVLEIHVRLGNKRPYPLRHLTVESLLSTRSCYLQTGGTLTLPFLFV